MLHQPVMSADCDKLLVKAAVSAAEALLALAAQIFEMEPDRPRMIEIGRKVMSGQSVSATDVENGVSNIGRQPVDMIAIPGLVV